MGIESKQTQTVGPADSSNPQVVFRDGLARRFELHPNQAIFFGGGQVECYDRKWLNRLPITI